MHNKKILLVDTLHSSFEEILNSRGFECIPGYHLSKEETLSQLKEFTGIAIRSRFRIDKDFIDRAGNIRFIARAGAGMENIDVNAAMSSGIICLNAPEGNRDAVGEHAIGMLLVLMNNLFRADKEVRNGIWKREENRGYELQGKTIGIIGFGNMGSAFAKKLSGFDVEMLAYDKYIKIDVRQYPFVKQVELDEILLNCDILSLHVPLSEETEFMINDQFLAKLRKPVWLVNTARGKVIETSALVNAIESGKVRGAVLDVLEYESASFEQLDSSKLPPAFQYLIGSDKVALSPHIAGWTHESNKKIAEVLAKKIIDLFKQ